MVIFLLILKIIGIVLLVIAAVILMALFVPVFYELDADIDEGKCRFRLHWLFHLVRFRFEFQEKAQAVLSILFFKMDFTDSEKNEKRKRKKVKRAAAKKNRAAKKRKRKKEKQRSAYHKEREKNKSKLDMDADIHSSPCEGETSQPSKTMVDGETIVKAAEKIEEATEKNGIHIPDNIRKVIRVVRAIYESKVFGSVLPKLQIFLIRIRPRKLRGHLEYGFADPSTTGQVLGLIAMIPFIFQTDLVIVPDFEAENAYIKGNVYLKGRIHGIYLVIFLIRIFSDKNVRKLIKNMK